MHRHALNVLPLADQGTVGRSDVRWRGGTQTGWGPGGAAPGYCVTSAYARVMVCQYWEVNATGLQAARATRREKQLAVSRFLLLLRFAAPFVASCSQEGLQEAWQQPTVRLAHLSPTCAPAKMHARGLASSSAACSCPCRRPLPLVQRSRAWKSVARVNVTSVRLSALDSAPDIPQDAGRDPREGWQRLQLLAR